MKRKVGKQQMKKIITSVLIVTTLALILCTSVSAASFGYGVQTIAEDVKIVKSGLVGRKLAFSDADFKQGLCITGFDTITITKIPPSTDGTLMLAGRRVGEGTSIKRKNLAALVFIPASKEIVETSFKFTVDNYAGGAEIEFIIKFAEEINYEPEISEEYTDSFSLETQREISVHGKMYAYDSEGDALEYIVVSYPKSGTLTIVDKSTGEYIYTPTDSYVGNDSFIYVARDEWGNFSKTRKVTVEVSERMSEVVYRDMTNRPEYNAAVTMTAMGIMGGKIVGDGVYFTPDEAVSRAEFVSMAMKALGIKADSNLSATYFDDNDKIPEPLVSYIATAQKNGIVYGSFSNGELLFRPNDKITKYEAAVIMANLMNKEYTSDIPTFSDESDIPSWARSDVYTMCALGIFEYSGNSINATDAVTRAECASYLYKMIK